MEGRDAMDKISSSALGIMLSISLVIPGTGMDAGQNLGDSGHAKVQSNRVEFQNRLAIYKEYCSHIHSGRLEPYIDNEAFRNLTDLGPVSIPWLINEQGAVKYTGMDMLLCDWMEMAGIRIISGWAVNGGSGRVGVFEQFDVWWKDAFKSMPQIVETRMAALRKMIQGKPKMATFNEIQVTREWKMIRDAGLFGIPHVINKVKNGQGDESDFRLLVYWTDPLERGRDGVLRKKPERAIMPEGKGTADYWIQWWQANAWQYWWLQGISGN
jgi:hypothetical protein